MNKVLLLSKEYPPHVYGGAGVHIDFLSRELAKLVDVEVRCFGKQKRDGGNGTASVRGFSAPAESVGDLSDSRRKAVEPLQVGLEMAATVTDADAVHCHTWYSMAAGVWAQKLYGIPLIVTAHSLEPLRPWKREQLGNGYDLSSWIERSAYESADAIIAVSTATRDEVLEVYYVDPERVHVIYNGIDLALFRNIEAPSVVERYATKYGFDPSKPFLLFVGRITRQKGVVHLVRALEHLDSDIQAVLCAGAPDTEEIGREMEAEVRRVGESRPGVYWVPEMVPVEDLVALYSAADMFVCPSVYEPFGIINLEAMACETPVVATAVGGIPEVVVHEETGLLVPFESGEGIGPLDADAFERELAAGIDRLAGDPELAKRFGAAGRQRAEDQFSWESVARKTLELYRKVGAPTVPA